MILLKVILREDVPNLGKCGEVKDVADGYARNMLLPRGLAEKATPKRLLEWENRRQLVREKATSQENQAREIAGRLEGKVVTFYRPSGEGGRLFGSVTAADVATFLEGEGFPIDKRKILLPEPIKHPGEHSISIKLGPSIKATVVVKVEQDSRED